MPPREKGLKQIQLNAQIKGKGRYYETEGRKKKGKLSQRGWNFKKLNRLFRAILIGNIFSHFSVVFVVKTSKDLQCFLGKLEPLA